MKEWITDPVGMAAKNKKDRKPPMKKKPISDAEVDALVAYLSTLAVRRTGDSFSEFRPAWLDVGVRGSREEWFGVDFIADRIFSIQLSNSERFRFSSLTLCIKVQSATCGDLLQWVMRWRRRQTTRQRAKR